MTVQTMTPEQLSQRLSAVLARESACTTTIRIRRNAHVYNCGDRDNGIYLIETGQVKTTTYSRDGKQCLLSIYAAKDIFGELCLLSADRTETATAMRNTVLRRIPVAKFRAALHDDQLLEAFLGHLAARVSEQQQVITNLVTMDCERRLAAALLQLGQKLGKRQPRGIRIDERITQEELSVMVGTTRSRIGFFLKRFCDKGLVQRPKDSFLLVDERSMNDYLDAA